MWDTFKNWRKPLEQGWWWTPDYFDETIDFLDGLIKKTKVIVIEVDEV